MFLLNTFTFLFIIGRFTFTLGYPNHRSFGMTMNLTGVSLVTILIAYRLLFKGILFRIIHKLYTQLRAEFDEQMS